MSPLMGFFKDALLIARTVADLDHAAALEPKHVSEAIQYRSLDRRGVA